MMCVHVWLEKCREREREEEEGGLIMRGRGGRRSEREDAGRE